jgi:glycosyltransferase involved in cell wall biosynthesis
LLANLQRGVSVVTTYHGSDINDKAVFRFSKMAMFLSAWNIFVSKKTLNIARPKKRFSLLPCGVDFSELQLTDKVEARKRMHLDANKHYILFAGAFDNTVKNASLAKEAMALLENEEVELLELNGYTRDEVTLLMCAVDAFLMTSVSEGSPQVIKEAMACGLPIVSTNVGDVAERLKGLEGCFVAESRRPEEITRLLLKTLDFNGKTAGPEQIVKQGLTADLTAQKLLTIYHQVLKK